MPTLRTKALRLLAYLTLSALVLSCASGTTTRPMQRATQATEAARPIAGSLEGLQSAVFAQDPVPGADVYERIQWALEIARATTAESYDADEALADIHAIPTRISPARAAQYRVDEALNLATIAATPSPHSEALSIEQRRLAEDRKVPPGHLQLWVPKAKERYDIQLYDETGRMRLAGVIEASRALRDHNSQVSKSINPRLLAMLYLIGQHFDSELQVISGYRVRGVNASRGSRHGSGEACDFRIQGVSIYTIAAYVESTFANLGMGVYPTSGFVHVDTRTPTFYWQDRSGPGQRSRTRARSISRRGDPDLDPTLRSIHMTEYEVFAWPRR